MDVKTIMQMEGSVKRSSLPYVKWSERRMDCFAMGASYRKK